jgi:diguanylate cyclase (GGDEF)-like protein/PAS domain S-box-containing protein
MDAMVPHGAVTSEKSPIQVLRKSALVLCLVVFALAAFIFMGWVLNNVAFLSVFSGQVSMKANVSLGLMLCSVILVLSLWPGIPGPLRNLSTVVAVLVAVLAILTLSQDIFGWSLGIDQWLFREPNASGRSMPGRMSPPTAFCFVLIGTALAMQLRPVTLPMRLPVVSALGLAVTIVAASSLIGHLVNTMQSTLAWNFSPIAVDTALALLLLGVALLVVVRSQGGLIWFADRLTMGGFIVGILALLIAASTAYYFVRQLQQGAVRVSHTHEVIKGIDALERDLDDATSALRGYVISGDERLTVLHDQKVSAARRNLQALHTLEAQEPANQHQLSQLEPMLAQSNQQGQQVIDQRRSRGFVAARQMLMPDGGMAASDPARQTLYVLRAQAYRLLALQQKNAAQNARETFLTLPLSVFISITMLLLGLFLLNANAGERMRVEEARRESDAWFRAIFEATSDGIIMTDLQKKIVMVNPAAEKMYGYAQGAMVGILIETLVPGLNRPEITGERDALLANLPGPSVGRAWQLDAVRPDGVVFPIEVVRSAFTSSRGTYVVGVTRDITDRLKMQDDLSEREAGLHRAQIVAKLSHVITGPEGSFIIWSDSLLTLVGLDGVRFPKSTRAWLALVHPQDRELFRAKAIEAGATGARTDFEYRLQRADGVWMDIRQVMEPFQTQPDAPGKGRWFNTIQDVTERKQAEARIQHLATHDELTDLPNRNLIRDRIAQAVSQARRNGRQFSLVYLDVDRFKVVNDAWGHPFGDTVLQAVGVRLSTLVREGDTVARLSGDEFLLLLSDVGKSSDAHAVVQKILDAFAKPMLLENREVYVGVSMGVSVYPHNGADADTLISNADVAMYRSKEMGRSTYQFFTEEMSHLTRQRVDLETRLRVAIEHQELHLLYQPKVDMVSGQIVGCEALLRWNHPGQGMILPGDFIPIAEESGLIVPIGDWVLRTACLQSKAWTHAGLYPGVVSVNVSARQFLQQDVVAWVLTTLQETGLAPELLELELTESLIAQDTEKAITTVARLKAAGVKLSIDDFGTGYSSLSYLKRFRVDTLKIDQSFIRDMLKDPEDAVIALAVIALAHSLRFKVIAEGVETAEHCDFLRQNGCDEMQGYYFSKPVSAAEFAAMLASGKRLA